MIYSIILIIFIIFFILSTQTMLLHPKPHPNIFDLPYSNNSDIWFKKQGNTKLLILLHGMYSSPKVFQEFSELIINDGWDIYLPVLPNSSSSTEDLISQDYYQWNDSLKIAFQKSLVNINNYQKVVLGGHSQGGSLALTICPSFEFLNGLILIAAPISMIHNKNSLIRNIGIYLSGFLHLILPNKGLRVNSRYKKERGLVENSFGSEEFYYGITLHSMHLGLKQSKKHLSDIKCPCLLIYEKGDQICNYKDSVYIKEHISSTQIKEYIFETSKQEEPYSKRHKLLSYKPIKQKVFQGIQEFLSQL